MKGGQVRDKLKVAMSMKDEMEEMWGENSQIPRFSKICGKLALFWKYLAIYHIFSTQVSQKLSSK